MMDSNNLSELEEMYLLSIALGVENGQPEPVPMSQVAEWMEVQPVSANHMIHKLQEMGLVEYIPYQGVVLTHEGRHVTNQVLRRRRLWEVFLVEHLKLPVAAADAVACNLEHDIPAEVADRLDVYLGWPATSPQGKLIPPAESSTQPPVGNILAQLPAGQQAIISHIGTESGTRKYLTTAGIQIGAPIEILTSISDGPILVRTSRGEVCQLSREISTKILVEYP